MSSTEPVDTYEALLQILHADLKVVRAAVYRRIDGSFALAASLDRGLAPAPFDAFLDADEGLPGLALSLRRRVTLFDREAEALPGPVRPAVLLCGPVWEQDRVEALVVIHDVPLLELTPSALSRVDALLAWASEARSRLARIRELSDPDYFDRTVGAYRYAYFVETLRRELQRARRHGLPLRVLRARILSFDEIPRNLVPAAREAVARALFAYLREGDTVGAAPQQDAFLAVLPMCEAATATALGFRMLRALEGASQRIPIRLSFEFVEPDSLGLTAAPAPPLEVAA